MDPATIMMIIQTALQAKKAMTPQSPTPGGPPGVMPPPQNTAAQLMTARAGAEQPERTKYQEIIDNAMTSQGRKPTRQFMGVLAAEQQKKPMLEEVEQRQKGEGPGTLNKVAMGAEIGEALRGMMAKRPSPRMIDFGSAATSGPQPTSTRFQRERSSKLNDYIRALLRRR